MNLLILAPACSILALAFAGYLAAKVLKKDEGTEQMKKIATAIRNGADAYLKRQYTGVIIFFAAMFVILGILASFGFITPFAPFAFISGGFFSGLSGFIGMKIATRANVRTTHAAGKSLNSALNVAFSSGAVMGLTVVGLGLLHVSIFYYLLDFFYRDLEAGIRIQNITSALITCGMGASAMALFARVGGGIFTKAADVGADLVGKLEAGIPEDDPRNPAVIADNVGDNVGDVAGMGADLYESYVGSIVATAALAVAAGLGVSGVTIPMIIAAIGIVASIIGTFFVKSGEKAEQKSLLSALRRGVYVSSAIIGIATFFLVWNVLGWDHIGVYFAILSGLIAGNLIGFCTEYFTSDTYKPTQKLAQTTKTGAATVIIGGLSLGMMSTFLPVVIVAVAIATSFYFAGGAVDYNMGLYGVGIAAVGMLSTLGITLATDAYGPVADNAGGIAEMTHQDPIVRERTDALDSLGNTTAATGKGFAIGSAALTALALIAAYRDQVEIIIKKENLDFVFNLSVLNPQVLIGLFIGGMVPFIFAALTMDAVGTAAQLIVVEVRRQFKEIVGLMEGKSEADYARCVDICTKSAQREMIMPALLAITIPIVVGLLLGVNGVVGLLAGATVTGFVLAIMMANSGGAWDNAKKHIEAGNLGGKGSDCHKAAVVGDTVGDPFKDTSGPSINILIKLLSMVSIVFAAFILKFSMF
ncbi:sodium-translocating pyrophosphatase [Clostridium sp. CM028]|uniref:sodium-translocating pyrophosphatase n=1 Tax=unclassified Clostridium TaxID=2614128 RepID=UPI001C0D7FE4|nr:MULTISPECIES: sodium-translocating pyrophosphatase [unclassified Clostridium]MBU3093735.1 sodium-translocating pyrophosphatase [Clostridium sp. CF011]MBW9146276.1 sodium-translocating pyrophosphatase [Clostridium sp. CM027]MBW9149926.1 sodium-translocating pyrophosphatase [Clostridium sp. CM028]UVE41821.1 sodium-translocating pyrophosphatase [Clostridium sp. CM027]WAG70823.1 sodium-translocating pyrophosphatase [Clostridium sp. CF011]